MVVGKGEEIFAEGPNGEKDEAEGENEHNDQKIVDKRVCDVH